MYIKSTILAILMAILSISASAGVLVQHKLATTVLNDLKVSYMVKTNNEKVEVVTFDYQIASKSCKSLRAKGVNVMNVKNYQQDQESGKIVTTYKDC